MEFRSLHAVETAENVPIKVELAGLSSRVFAALIDVLLMLVLMGILLVAFSMPPLPQTMPQLGKTAIPIGMFIIFFGYHLFQEWLWNGKTVGKILFQIRVVRHNGQAIGFWEAFGRNLMRVLDVYASGLGLFVMLFNREEKRLGDFLAGTLVISDLPAARPLRPPIHRAPDAGVTNPSALVTSEQGPVINAEEAALLGAFRSRRKSLFGEARQAMSGELCRYFSERLHQPLTTEADLDALWDRYHQVAL